MGLLFQLIEFLVEAFIAVWVLVAVVSIFGGLVRFLIAAPGAIREDLKRWRLEHPRPQRMIRYVRNEAEDATALPPQPALPPMRDPPRCPCGGEIVRRTTLTDGSPSFGCSRYPNCRRTWPAS